MKNFSAIPAFPMVCIDSRPHIPAHLARASLPLWNLVRNKEAEIGAETRIRLQVGKIRLLLHVDPVSDAAEADFLRLSPSVLKKTGLEKQKYGFFWDEKNRILRIGPVVGIMAEATRDTLRPFHKQTVFFAQMLEEAAHCGVLAYVFSPSDVKEHRLLLRGSVLKNGRWIQKFFPFPDVVYPRHSGYAVHALRIREKMKNRGASFINPPLIGKWKTFRILSRYPELKEHIPDTERVQTAQSIHDMLEKWQAVFVKPVNGSQGKNIIRIEKGKQEYSYQYQMNQKMHRGSASDLRRVFFRLRRVMSGQTHIVQQQIRLLRVENRVADVRVVVQKNRFNHWQVTGKAFRIGYNGSITSNISSGGYAQPVKRVLNLIFSVPQAEALVEKIDWLALQTAQKLEENMGSIGEFGIDIGVDTDGRVWLIEANLKPGRQVFSLLNDPEGRQRSVRMPLLYARFLAGFEAEKKEGGDV